LDPVSRTGLTLLGIATVMCLSCASPSLNAEHSVLPSATAIPGQPSGAASSDISGTPRAIPGCARRSTQFTESTQIDGVDAATFNNALSGEYAFLIEWRELDYVTEVPFQLTVNQQGHSIRAGTGKPGCQDLVYVDFELTGEQLAGRIIAEDRGYAVLGGEILASTFVKNDVVPQDAIPKNFRDPAVTEFRVIFGIRTANLLATADEHETQSIVGTGKSSVRFTHTKGNENKEGRFRESYGTIAKVSMVRR
jgi:hypothetical protein